MFQAQHPHAAHTPTQAAGPQRYPSTHGCKWWGCFPFISHYHHTASIQVKKYEHPRTPLTPPRKLSFCLVTSQRVLSDFGLDLVESQSEYSFVSVVYWTFCTPDPSRHVSAGSVHPHCCRVPPCAYSTTPWSILLLTNVWVWCCLLERCCCENFPTCFC